MIEETLKGAGTLRYKKHSKAHLQHLEIKNEPLILKSVQKI